MAIMKHMARRLRGAMPPEIPAACGAFLIGCILLWVETFLGPVGKAGPQYLVPAVALAGAALALRRTRPLTGLGLAAAAVALDLAAGPSLLPVPVLIHLLYLASLHGPARAAPWLSRAGCAVSGLATLAVLVTTADVVSGLLTMVCTSLVLVWPAAMGLTVRAHWECAERALRIAKERFKSAARERVAGDLHDIVGNRLSAIALQSNAAMATAPRDDETHLTALQELRNTSLEGVGEVRRMVATLRSDGSGTSPWPGPAPALLEIARTLLDRVERLGSPARLRTVGTPVALRGEVETAACRIIQESVTNALKHARGSDVEAVITYQRDRLVLTVQNGLPPAGAAAELPGSGFGLISMSNRAERIGGSCTARRLAGRWRVDAVLPLHPARPSGSFLEEEYLS